jgi:hypothetical protein
MGSFLATLLDTLLAGVHGTFAASLLGQLFAGFLVCREQRPVSDLQFNARTRDYVRTSCLLGFKSLIFFVFLNHLLLRLFVVDGVGTSYTTVSVHALHPAQCFSTYLLVLKAFLRLCVADSIVRVQLSWEQTREKFALIGRLM